LAVAVPLGASVEADRLRPRPATVSAGFAGESVRLHVGACWRGKLAEPLRRASGLRARVVCPE
ncbi:hypothetical protein LZ189_02965, partial [Rhodovulum sulfidophilum]|nr:hypothetical protein [Rhodovulum sulfidophilum]